MVIVESIWPNAAFEGGIGINALTSDEAAFPNGIASGDRYPTAMMSAVNR